MLEGFSSAIIAGETNYIRFEKFCLALAEMVESRTFVATSLNYDQGRDARSAGGGRGSLSHGAILCATLNQEIDEKVKRDLDRIKVTTSPERLIYCCSQELTELHVDRLTATIRSYVPRNCSVALFANQQLSELAERYPGVLEAFYKAEISTIEANLFAFRTGHEPAETRGLRLALMTLGSDDAVTLRRTLSSRAIIEVLARIGSASQNEIIHRLSDDLRLPTGLNKLYIQEALANIEGQGFAQEQNGRWDLTPAGKAEASRVPETAARELLQGRTTVRSVLDESIGFKITDSQFDAIWSALLDVLSELFHSNGVAVVCAINAFLEQSTTGTDGPSLEKLIEEGAARIRATASMPELGADFEQAVRDMFTERTGPAFEWLARVCERFVALCALGLETTSADEVRRVLRRYQLVLDTDVVLTVLCEGEPAHQATREIIAAFRKLGGAVLLSPSVLEEVAYHAHISDREYRQTVYLTGKLTGSDPFRYITNAFVRAFHTVVKNPKQWAMYRSQFVGSKPRDYSKILHTLQSELGSQMLPTAHDPKLAKRISEYMKGLAAAAGKPETFEFQTGDIGKAGRDGQILACIAAARQRKRESGADAAIVLLTSSARLRRADREFRQSLGEPAAVLSFKGLTYMLSLVPTVGFGAGTLRQALFDFGETATLTDVERLALRVIKGSGQFNLPWAKRRALQAQLEAVIRREADKRGVPPARFESQLAAGDKSTHPGELIALSLRELAIRDKQTMELIAASNKIRSLEAELDRFRKAADAQISRSVSAG